MTLTHPQKSLYRPNRWFPRVHFEVPLAVGNRTVYESLERVTVRPGASKKEKRDARFTGRVGADAFELRPSRQLPKALLIPRVRGAYFPGSGGTKVSVDIDVPTSALVGTLVVATFFLAVFIAPVVLFAQYGYFVLAVLMGAVGLPLPIFMWRAHVRLFHEAAGEFTRLLNDLSPVVA